MNEKDKLLYDDRTHMSETEKNELRFAPSQAAPPRKKTLELKARKGT
jgi:hypothetical protein